MEITFAEWLAVRSRKRRGKSLSVHTLRQKASALATVSGRASDLFGTRNLSDLATTMERREAVELLFDSLATTHAAGSVRNLYFALRDFERYAKAMAWSQGFALHEDDCPISEGKARTDTFTPEEVTALEVASRMSGFRWHLFVATLIHTGRRIGDVLDLTYGDIRLDVDVPHLVLSAPKGATKPQYAPLNTHLRTLYTYENLADMRNTEQGAQYRTSRDPDVYLFPWTYVNARQRWVTMLDKLGIRYRNPHQLRHTKATQLIAQGTPLNGVSKLLGHQTTNTTERFYDHVTSLAYAEYLD